MQTTEREERVFSLSEVHVGVLRLHFTSISQVQSSTKIVFLLFLAQASTYSIV